MPNGVTSARVVYLPAGPLTAADDATLATAMIAGDVQAPRVAWLRFAPMVHRMFKRTFGPVQEVEDMVQDVFLCLFRKVGGLREPKALKAFIIAITARTIKYELRQRRARRWLRLAAPISEVDVPTLEQPDAVSRRALVRFYEILDRLSPHDRTAFVLRFFEGLPLNDVAQALGISLSTTKRHLNRVWERMTVLIRHSPELQAYLSEASVASDGAILPPRDGDGDDDLPLTFGQLSHKDNQ